MRLFISILVHQLLVIFPVFLFTLGPLSSLFFHTQNAPVCECCEYLRQKVEALSQEVRSLKTLVEMCGEEINVLREDMKRPVIVKFP